MPSHNEIEQKLLELEQRLAEGEFDASPDALDELLSDDFREFGGTGREYEKAQAIALLTSGDAAPAPSEMHDIAFQWLGDSAVQLSYRSIRQGRGRLRSSLWRLHEGRWQMCFHQATPGA